MEVVSVGQVIEEVGLATGVITAGGMLEPGLALVVVVRGGKASVTPKDLDAFLRRLLSAEVVEVEEVDGPGRSFPGFVEGDFLWIEDLRVWEVLTALPSLEGDSA